MVRRDHTVQEVAAVAVQGVTCNVLKRLVGEEAQRGAAEAKEEQVEAQEASRSVCSR